MPAEVEGFFLRATTQNRNHDARQKRSFPFRGWATQNRKHDARRSRGFFILRADDPAQAVKKEKKFQARRVRGAL